MKTNLPTLKRSEEQLSDGRWYVNLWDIGTRWSAGTSAHERLEDCYREARQIVTRKYQIGSEAVITDWHGAW